MRPLAPVGLALWPLLRPEVREGLAGPAPEQGGEALLLQMGLPYAAVLLLAGVPQAA